MSHKFPGKVKNLLRHSNYHPIITKQFNAGFKVKHEEDINIWFEGNVGTCFVHIFD